MLAKAAEDSAFDVLLVLGGDGTMLGAARRYAPHGTLIFGLNLGRVGFLLDTEISSLEAAVDDIEAQIQNSLDREVPASRIGEYAMKKLKDIDEVAYVRFASVYRQFKDINSFHEEINRLLDEDDKK